MSKIFKKAFLLFIFFGNFTGCITESTSKSDTGDSEKISEENHITPVFHKSLWPLKKNAPFSDVVQVGNMYYLSGQIGMDHSVRALVKGGIIAETEQIFENIRDVLSQHNLHFRNIIKVTVVLDDIENFSAFNEIYIKYLPLKPARTTFAAKDLARGAKIEIEVTAYKFNNSKIGNH